MCNCERNSDNCKRNLVFTANIYKPNERDLPVYICQNCKRYYILAKINSNVKLVEVNYNHDLNKWFIVK